METKRNNEPANILNRNKLEQCPPNINEKQWKKFRKKYNDASKLIRIETPAQIDIELNSNCNLRCSFCIQSIKKIENKSLSFPDYKNIIDQCRRLNITSLKLNYMNEPLLKKDIFEYIKYAKDNGFINIFFSTNGILLNIDNIKKIIYSGVTKIFISVDAFQSKTYKKLRKSNKLKSIKQNILNFLRIRNELGQEYPIIRLNFLNTNENKYEKDDFIDYWINKVDMINVQEMNELIDSKTNLYIKKKENYKCSMPFKQLVVNASGDILPCCTMYAIRHKIGNIKNITLSEAWESEKINYLRNIHEQGKIKTDKICKECIYGK